VPASRRSLLVGLSLVAGGLVAVVTAAVPALASGQVCAGMVIDDGNGAAPLTQGATVSPGSSDLDLLHAVGDVVAQNNAGLVCAIDDYPPNGLQSCLSASHGLFYYWSYWEGDPATNTWTYANIGPAEHTVTAGQSYVEGWRYQDPGPDSPAAPKPSVSPATALAKACSSSNPVPTTSVGTPTTGVPATTSPSPAHAAAPPATNGRSVPGSTAPPSARGAVNATTTTVATRSGTVPPSGASGLPTSTTSTTPSLKRSNPKSGAAKLALSSKTEHRGSGGDPMLPIVLVVVVIGGLCAVAWFRWRRRPREG
jgi:hypothetical protein